MLILTQSCKSPKESYRKYVVTEIFCANDKKIMIRYLYVNEVINGIKSHINRKAQLNTKDNFTVINSKNIQSYVPKIPPEDLIKCQMIERNINDIFPSYIKKF